MREVGPRAPQQAAKAQGKHKEQFLGLWNTDGKAYATVHQHHVEWEDTGEETPAYHSDKTLTITYKGILYLSFIHNKQLQWNDGDNSQPATTNEQDKVKDKTQADQSRDKHQSDEDDLDAASSQAKC